MNKLYLIFLIFGLSCVNQKEAKEEDERFNQSNNTKEELVKLAKSSYESDDFGEAINYFTQLINLDSSKGEYYYKRGFSFASIDSTESSIADYLIAAKLDYRPDDAYFNMGLNFRVIWDYPLAIYCFHRSLQLDPEATDAIQEIAECKRKQKERTIRRSESPMYKEMSDSIKFEHRKRLESQEIAKEEIKKFFEEYDQWAKVFYEK
ncbi:tetratricopeptide repeat protein [Xanthovirga aplysinae]|uniref:tetratricopeptide repeat protein n=1 Tax=Xanthovirga aplysinae TaxID=2529853 RepID=UPI0012BC86CC|nr:hypothetical protein [Xanthovirga aplysinae]MTI30502.1 hypothetical protein [Xanthovirga aplysinae]